MTERNKLLAILVVGLLVGFGLGRLIPATDATPNVVADEGSDSTDIIVTGDDGVGAIVEDQAQTGGQLGASLSGGLTSSHIDRPQAQRTGVGLSVLDQNAGENVLVASVAVTAPTWVAVHADRDGLPGNVLGARRVDANTSGLIIPLLRNTEKQETYYVLLQEDNGNGTYDLYIDPELTNLEGELIAGIFVAQ